MDFWYKMQIVYRVLQYQAFLGTIVCAFLFLLQNFDWYLSKFKSFNDSAVFHSELQLLPEINLYRKYDNWLSSNSYKIVKCSIMRIFRFKKVAQHMVLGKFIFLFCFYRRVGRRGETGFLINRKNLCIAGKIWWGSGG